MLVREQKQYVTFSFMGEEYAVEISHVKEIIECEPVTLIPTMPPVVRGVINLRGTVVAVVDLALKFGQPATPLGAGSYIVLFDLLWHDEPVSLGVLTQDLGRV